MVVAVRLISASQCTDQQRVLFVSLQLLQVWSKNSHSWCQYGCQMVPSLLCPLSSAIFPQAHSDLFNSNYIVNSNLILTQSQLSLSSLFFFHISGRHSFWPVWLIKKYLHLILSEVPSWFLCPFVKSLSQSSLCWFPTNLFLRSTIPCPSFQKDNWLSVCKRNSFLLDSYLTFLAIILNYLHKT